MKLSSDEEERQSILAILERYKELLARLERSKQDAIRELALELENLGIAPELVGEMIVRGLEGYASERYIQECLDKKYKRKYTKSLVKKRTGIASLPVEASERNEEKKPIVIDTEGRPQENEISDEEDHRSEPRIRDQVEAAAEGDKPVWYEMDREELVKLVEAQREDNQRTVKRLEGLEDQNRAFFERIQELLKRQPATDDDNKQRDDQLDALRKEIEELKETARRLELERDEFKEIAAKKNLVEATQLMPKPGEIRMKARDFNDVVQIAALSRQEIRIEHDGLRAVKLVRITGGERR